MNQITDGSFGFWVMHMRLTLKPIKAIAIHRPYDSHYRCYQTTRDIKERQNPVAICWCLLVNKFHYFVVLMLCLPNYPCTSVTWIVIIIYDMCISVNNIKGRHKCQRNTTWMWLYSATNTIKNKPIHMMLSMLFFNLLMHCSLIYAFTTSRIDTDDGWIHRDKQGVVQAIIYIRLILLTLHSMQ